MKTLMTPSGGYVRVSESVAQVLLANGYKQEPVKETPKPAPKPSQKKTPAKKKTPVKTKEV